MQHLRKQADADVLKGHKNLIPVLVDISDEAQCLAAARTVESELQRQNLRLLGLVNNAAYSQPAVLELVQLKHFKKLFESKQLFAFTAFTSEIFSFLCHIHLSFNFPSSFFTFSSPFSHLSF